MGIPFIWGRAEYRLPQSDGLSTVASWSRLIIDFSQSRNTNSARFGLSGGWRATLALDIPGPYTPTEAKWRVTCMQFMRREADGSRRGYPRP